MLLGAVFIARTGPCTASWEVAVAMLWLWGVYPVTVHFGAADTVCLVRHRKADVYLSGLTRP